MQEDSAHISSTGVKDQTHGAKVWYHVHPCSADVFDVAKLKQTMSPSSAHVTERSTMFKTSIPLVR